MTKSKASTSDNSSTACIPYRQIRAVYDDETITVYQAYSESIATAAVREQKLSASPEFIYNRMTWIKPSWCWMMYRSGYALKDARQTHILALKMKHSNFRKLLMSAAVCQSKTPFTSEEKNRLVRVQWDPERSFRLGELPYRSIQIGISRGLSQKWVEEWVESIEDVTEMAARLREVVERAKMGDGKVDGTVLGVEELIELGCLPRERVYELDEETREWLKMDRTTE